MNAHANFGDDRQFSLKSAILFYQESDNGSGRGGVCAATVHDVITVAGIPQLQAGQPLTIGALETLARDLGNKLDDCLLPENMLCIGLGRMAWWCPASRHRIWFNPNSEKDQPLKALNGKWAFHPPLLFIAGNRLRIHALAENRRPDADTKIYRAPYFNLDEDGDMCHGNVKMPSVVSPESIPDFEDAFFNSSFSHASYGHTLTTHPGGHAGLWQEMCRLNTSRLITDHFPTKYLVPAKLTLGQLLKSHD